MMHRTWLSSDLVTRHLRDECKLAAEHSLSLCHDIMVTVLKRFSHICTSHVRSVLSNNKQASGEHARTHAHQTFRSRHIYPRHRRDVHPRGHAFTKLSHTLLYYKQIMLYTTYTICCTCLAAAVCIVERKWKKRNNQATERTNTTAMFASTLPLYQ